MKKSIIGKENLLSADTGLTAEFTAASSGPAALATGSTSGGVLTSTDDNTSNAITFSRNAAGLILINNGAVPISGGVPTVANTTLIQAFGQGGNDKITLDETDGALPRANLFGGTGKDTLTGGSGADQLFGQTENDILFGKGGADFLFGGTGDDVLTGGDADDQVFGEAGNDRFIWNPGDDTDLWEGGADFDIGEVNGGNGTEVFTLTANGTRVRFDRLDPAPFSIDMGTLEQVVLNMNGGDDSFSATGNLAALVQVTVDGGAGNDTILGSNGNDTLFGGEGNDFIDGQQGNDTVFLGVGDDVFQWDPGDGSDVVEGQSGNDRLLFNGSAANEQFVLQANGTRTSFTRNIANIAMDLASIETVQVNALGGSDSFMINDLSRTNVRAVAVNLASSIGGTTGDGAADTVTVLATSGRNVIDVVGTGSGVSVSGLKATVDVTASEGANDSLVIQAVDGDDTITATTLVAGVTKLVLDGGAGNDSLRGSQGADVLFGGEGHDFIFGDNGDDVAFLGAGDDRFEWAPGDGNDTIEGQEGDDELLFAGSNAAENINIVANGGRVLFLRDVANVTMDLNDVETIKYQALGGADTITVGDLIGTDATNVAINLRNAEAKGDGAADTVTVNGTQGADTIDAATVSKALQVTGLTAVVDIIGAEAASDRLVLNGGGGDDIIDAVDVKTGSGAITFNGGLGADTLRGSGNNELFNGGDGNDVAFMGAGNDVFVWNPGDDNDVVEGQAGTDTLQFNGANINEEINILANGARALFTRNVANVVMDLNDVETIAFKALGGADTIRIADMRGTDVKEVQIDLTGSGGVGDGAADTIVIEGADGDEVITTVGGALVVTGLSVKLTITGFEAGVDSLVINALAARSTVASLFDAESEDSVPSLIDAWAIASPIDSPLIL